MKTINIPKVIGLVCASIIVSIANISFTINDEIIDNVSNLVYKSVPDTRPYVENREKLKDNFQYKEWCEKTFENGNFIYEAYKDIAFNIKYTQESNTTDFWQTPVETAKLKKGDCEDAVFLFFSHLPSDQKNAEIAWGWVINKRSKVGKGHVWYQLVDHKGKQYFVEGFSKDWNGIMPMERIEETELRRPILTIAHSEVSRLAGSLPKTNDTQNIQSLVHSLVATNFSNRDLDNQSFSQDMDTLFLPNMSKEISNILSKLHKLFSRYEMQKEEANIQAVCKSNIKKL